MNNLHEVEMFIAFLDLVKNPEKHEKMLEEMKARTAEYKQVVEAYTDVQSANKYFDRLKTEYAEKQAKINKAQADLDASKKAFEEERKDQMEKHSQRMAKADETLQDARKKEKEVNALLEVQRMQLTQIEQDKDRLRKEQEMVSAFRKKLEEKERKVREALGG